MRAGILKIWRVGHKQNALCDARSPWNVTSDSLGLGLKHVEALASAREDLSKDLVVSSWQTSFNLNESGPIICITNFMHARILTEPGLLPE
jgi:hypothetical protein